LASSELIIKALKMNGNMSLLVNHILVYLCSYCVLIMMQIIVGQIEPLTEQQILGIYGLQQSTQENEDALSQGLEALNQSLSNTIASESLICPPNMANYMGQMTVAMNKLSTLEGFVRQVRMIYHHLSLSLSLSLSL
jgi:hypothetical protein